MRIVTVAVGSAEAAKRRHEVIPAIQDVRFGGVVGNGKVPDSGHRARIGEHAGRLDLRRIRNDAGTRTAAADAPATLALSAREGRI